MVAASSEVARELGEALPDDLFSFISRCLLFRGRASAWVEGPPRNCAAAVVRDPHQPFEPVAFGTDAEAIWRLLREIPGWTCVNCTTEVAPELGRVLERELSWPTRRLGDLYSVLDGPPVRHDRPGTRLLTEDDVALFEEAAEPLRVAGYDSSLAALTGGVVAGAVEEGRLVATVSMTESSETYANLGAYTLEPWRGRGLGTAAGYLAAREVQRRGLEPVWSTGEENLGSRRVARKLGFRERGRKEYLIVPELQRTGGFRPDLWRAERAPHGASAPRER